MTKNFYQQLQCLDPYQFHVSPYLSPSEMNVIKTRADALPLAPIFGIFDTPAAYIETLDILIASSREIPHSDEMLERYLWPTIPQNSSLLDIGVGNGMLSYKAGVHFANVTVVDTEAALLDNVPDFHWVTHTPIRKIHGSIIDCALPEPAYDMILLGHVMYYIPPNDRGALIDKLYHHLNPNGKIVILYNEKGERLKMTEHFGGERFTFDVFEEYILDHFTTVSIWEVKEMLQAQDIHTMLHIAGVCLNDAGAKAEEGKLAEYLKHHYHEAQGYQLSMQQKMLVIQHDEALQTFDSYPE